ncbi:hypothetical protein XENOCAPTIV_028750 [Xenoophorus captivus]|uniref:Uncharacterized protein n=1 Tax=Xenoophorus captivus TaxID=1517983 RepID=A0ABV0Q3G4_9TELE
MKQDCSYPRELQGNMSDLSMCILSLQETYDTIPGQNKITFLLQAVRDASAAEEVRQMAAVLLRRLLSSSFEEIYPGLTLEMQTVIKTELLTSIQQETSQNIRKKVCDIAAELCRNLIGDDSVLKSLVEIADTAPKYLRPNLEPTLQLCLKVNFKDGIFCQVISALLQTMEDQSNPRVQAHAAAALINFTEDCPKSLLIPYLDSLVQHLHVIMVAKLQEVMFIPSEQGFISKCWAVEVLKCCVLHQLIQKGTKLVLEQVVTSIASVADTAEEKFVPYYDLFMPSLKHIVENAVQKELRLLRGKTIECISLIGLAVGKDKVLMQLLLKTQTDFNDLEDDDPQCARVRGPEYLTQMWHFMCDALIKAIGTEPDSDVLSEIMHSFAKDENDVYILTKVSDILHSVFSSYKEKVLPWFEQLLQLIVQLIVSAPLFLLHSKWSKPRLPSSFKYAEYFLRPMLQSLCDTSPEVRQAAAYGVGVMAQYGGDNYRPFCTEALPLLVGVIQAADSRSKENVNATENCISAVGKLMRSRPECVNVSEVLPHWLSWLPLKEDKEEAVHTFHFLCDLIER